MSTISSHEPEKQQRWIGPLLWLAPIIVIFAPVLFADRSFAFRDGAHFYHPLFQWIANEWGQGRVPLWNPQENCGLPVLADATSSIFYPGKLIFILPLPFVWLYKFYVVGHVVLAAATMYALARRLQASEAGAALAAMAYACGGNVVFQYCNIVFLVGAAWLPAALWAIEVIVSARSWRTMLLFAVVLAMMILGGDPQMAYHALLAAGLRFLFAILHSLSPVLRGAGTKSGSNSLSPVLRGEGRGEGLPASGPSTEKPLTLTLSPEYRGEGMVKYNFISAVILAAAAIIAFLLAAVQILPSSEATKSSERAAYNRPRNVYEAAAVLTSPDETESLLAETTSEKLLAGLFGQPEPSSHHDRAYDYSISPWQVIEFVWPNISGRAFPQNQRWLSRIPGASKPWTPTLYLGLLPFLAGVAALRFRNADATTRWLSWLVLIFALGSLGWYGLGWLIRECYASILRGDSSQLGIGAPVGGLYWLMVTLLPAYVYFRYPAKLMVVAVCGLTALAAPSADRMFAARSERWLLALKIVMGLSVLLAFGVWCASPFLLKIPPIASQVFGPFNMQGALFDVISGLLHTAVVAGALHWILRKIWDSGATQGNEQAAARWKWGAVALTAVEIAIANAWLIFTAPAPLWNEPSPVALAIRQQEELQPAAEQSAQPRFFRGSYHNWHAPSFAEKGSSQRMEQIARWDHATLSHKYHLPTGLQLVESYGSVKPIDYDSLFLAARNVSNVKVDGAAMPTAGALRTAACEYLVLPAAARLSFAEPITPPASLALPQNVSLWRMNRPMPRAWVVHRVVQFPPLANSLNLAAVDQRAIDVLTEKRDGKSFVRDFRQLAVVETADRMAAELLQADRSAPASVATIVSDDPQHVRIKAAITQPGLLVLADSFGPGWIATIQRAEDQSAAPRSATIHRTNRCFRGVELPAGEWLIDFEYHPTSFYRGAWLSSLAWLALILSATIGVVGSRRHH